MDKDPFNLNRFIEAQRDVYDRVVEELREGQKRSHWMWFIFPQYAGLGISSTAQYYAIKSLPEAEAYLAHPLLGKRIKQCTEIVNAHCDRTSVQIFGGIDSMKFCSSMTLFELAAGKSSVFSSALDSFFSGRRDQKSLELIIR